MTMEAYKQLKELEDELIKDLCYRVQHTYVVTSLDAASWRDMAATLRIVSREIRDANVDGYVRVARDGFVEEVMD